MLFNHIKFSFRSLMRQKGYTLLNIAGLGVGIAIALMIAVFVSAELLTDRFHENYQRIYRLEARWVATPSAIRDVVSGVLPEALEVCRIYPGFRNLQASIPDKQTRIQEVVYADNNFFRVFSFDLLHGDPQKALSHPMSIVLSQSEAKKLFGEEYPVGKVVKLNNQLDYEVTGIMQDPPPNSILKQTAVVPFKGYANFVFYPEQLNEWTNWNYQTFLLLPQEHDLQAINEKLAIQMDRYFEQDLGRTVPEVKFFLRPLKDIYFNRHIENDAFDKGNMTFVVIYSTIGVFILLIAAINFINISTAMAFRRSREVGMKKVLGSSRASLIRQYLTESVLICLSALLVALVLFEILLPVFNQLIDSQMQIHILKHPLIILLVIGFTIVLGLFAGLYPAFFLARFSPMVVLRGDVVKGRRGALLRKILIVFQFTISVGIILSTLVIFNQMKYARSKDMGFNRENIIVFASRGNIPRDYASFKGKLKQIAGVEFVGLSNQIPGYVKMGWERNLNETPIRMAALPVDPEFMDVYGLRITRGRSFEETQLDVNKTYILNEAAVKAFGLEEPVGAKFSDGTIIGVAADFSYLSVHHPIGPLVLAYMPSWSSFINIKLNGHDVQGTLKQIEQVYQEYVPDTPFSYSFLNDSIGRLYEQEARLSRLFLFFSVLAIFVACLGLSGLALFSTQQRTREVGIRKVFGSSSRAVVLLLTGDFLRWILLANLIAWPLSWYLMDRWLDNFAFRISISWWMFAVSAAIVLLISLATISFQAVKAAVANPIQSLKYE